jgi:hypothetical protein
MKITVFCDVAPCSLVKFTDVSEVLTAAEGSHLHLTGILCLSRLAAE